MPSHRGRGMPAYVGVRRRQVGSGAFYSGNMRRQMGGSIFGFFRRMIVPLAKKIFRIAKPHIKRVGKEVGSEALRVGTEAAGDLMRGNVHAAGDTLKRESKKSLNMLSEKYIGEPVFQQDGKGRKRIAKQQHHQPSKRRKIAKDKPTKKADKKQKTKRIVRDIFTK